MKQLSSQKDFGPKIESELGGALQNVSLKTLQVNMGLYCNQVCKHCHVQAGPKRTEMMTLETLDKVVDLAAQIKPELIDITGGAPELHPLIRTMITKMRGLGINLQMRTNFTALLESPLGAESEIHGESENDGIINFLKENEVSLVGSLPCYLESNVDQQRGKGVYDASLTALQQLNKAGFGTKGGLPLTLVYNPTGPNLPPAQQGLEADYKRILKEDHQIEFHHLIAITNMPLGFFKSSLKRKGQLDGYMQLLQDSFNPENLSGLMCREQIHISWDGEMSDCDFNYALGLKTTAPKNNIAEAQVGEILGRDIVTGNHCFGCTAGAGSSCSGVLAG